VINSEVITAYVYSLYHFYGLLIQHCNLLVQKSNISDLHLITVTYKKTTDIKDTRVR